MSPYFWLTLSKRAVLKTKDKGRIQFWRSGAQNTRKTVSRRTRAVERRAEPDEPSRIVYTRVLTARARKLSKGVVMQTWKQAAGPEGSQSQFREFPKVEFLGRC